MRIRKRKWVAPYLEKEDRYLVREKPLKLIAETVYLELGMGMGDFIAHSAATNKDILYIGFEKEMTCVAKACQKFNELDIDNVLVIHDDIKCLAEYFDRQVDRIYLPFSDPWPKKGHTKRRLTHKNFLDLYKDILKDDGVIILKTDNSPFFDFSIMSFLEDDFKMIEFSTDRHRIPNEDILTAYERKFIEEGKQIYYAVFKKATSGV